MYIPLSVLTTEGDMLYENASLGKMRLPIGKTNQILSITGGLPAWAYAAPQFFPETYGAVGNGVTDDTAAIQAAINACSSNGGGWVVLGAKTYLISSALTITTNNVNMRGQGMYNTTILQSSASADVIQLTGTSYTVPIFGIQLEDFAIKRSLQPTGTASGVKYTYTIVTHTRRLYVWDCIYAFNIAHGDHGLRARRPRSVSR